MLGTKLTTVVAALALAAGALLYFSDHDNIDRHWRIALMMVLSATLIVIFPKARPNRGGGSMKIALLMAFALTGCSVKASHALMTSGLVVATGGAVASGEYRELAPASVSVGLAIFAVGWILHQSSDPSGGTAPNQQIYSSLNPPEPAVAATEKLGIYRRLPSDHVMFTP